MPHGVLRICQIFENFTLNSCPIISKKKKKSFELTWRILCLIVLGEIDVEVHTLGSAKI